MIGGAADQMIQMLIDYVTRGKQLRREASKLFIATRTQLANPS
jgi:hypothetical protein